MGLSRQVLSLPSQTLTPVNDFASISSLASASLTTVISYTVPAGKTFYLRMIEFGGGNIATYDVIIDSIPQARRRTYFGGSLSSEFFFDALTVAAGKVIELKVIHGRPMTADFEGRVLGYLS